MIEMTYDWCVYSSPGCSGQENERTDLSSQHGAQSGLVARGSNGTSQTGQKSNHCWQQQRTGSAPLHSFRTSEEKT